MNSISESFKTHPMHRDYITPLDFHGVEKLPDSHNWHLSGDNPKISPSAIDSINSIPVIDLKDSHATELIFSACQEWGAFQITNHGIAPKLLEDLEHQAREFFALPAERKLLALRSADGYTGYGLPRISALFPKFMWSEAFSMTGSPVEQASKVWPHDHTKFCDVMVECQSEMKALTEQLIHLTLKSLGLTGDELTWLNSKEPQVMFQLNSYPVCPSPSQAMGLASHTDSSILTLLYQSNTKGLQVRHDDMGWTTVHPVPGAVIVNLGDLMHILSNGRFKSAVHRALVNNAQQRFSMAYFYGPPKDVKISPLIKLAEPDHPPLYRPVTWKEYLDVKAVNLDNAFDLIRFDPNVVEI